MGVENRAWFERTLLCTLGGLVACARGVHGEHSGQDGVVLGWLQAFGVHPYVLGLARDGHPRHPLYLSKGAELVPY